jgi:hypothetical protein
MNAHEGRELPIRSGSPSPVSGVRRTPPESCNRTKANDGSRGIGPAFDSSSRGSHAWTLTDFRRFWTSPARHRWLRALALAPPRDLTNFGDLR